METDAPVAAHPMTTNASSPAPRALLSVSRKDGLPEFARGLVERGFELVASGGTARALQEAGIPVLGVSDVTGHPEVLDGRVKTLHPAIHAGVLARPSRPDDLASLESLGIRRISLVAVNFYPFERTVAAGAAEDEALENIDIGGPCLVRAAAKNWPGVTVVVDPDDYPAVLASLDEPEDAGRAFRRRLALRAFAATAAYEAAISGWFASLDGERFPERLVVAFDRIAPLRYGENPNQQAALYGDGGPGVPGSRQLQGKELSYNNILDLDAAVRCVADLATLPAGRRGAAAAVIKHSNPAGAAIAPTVAEAWVAARATDPVSAFGGVVALSGVVEASTAKELRRTFLEAIAAPRFTAVARRLLRRKKSLRLLEVPALEDCERFVPAGRFFARVAGGLLAQDWDAGDDESRWKTVSAVEPDAGQLESLRFAWRAVKHVKSNAIVVARGTALLGVGAGQMSRLDSCRLAVEKATVPLEGAVAASDAFFPFDDGLAELARAGVTAVIQPGGSVRDAEVIAAADARGVALVHTGARHFRH